MDIVGSGYKLFAFGAMMAALIPGINSCNKTSTNGVPIYLHIDSSKLLSNAFFGSASCDVPGVWPTSGNLNLGGYELPVDIPILASGIVPIALTAGIYDNGVVNAPAKYPFYFPDTFTIYNAIPGHVYHHKPVYSYVPSTQVGLNETFDGTGSSFSNITLLTNTADSSVYEGLRSGGIVLSSSVDTVQALQALPMVINTGGREAYMELNYKINNPNVLCDVGIIATIYSNGQITNQINNDIYEIYNNFGTWHKLYLNCNNLVGAYPNYNFQIYFIGRHTKGQQDTVYLDNIKLLYFTN